MGQFIDGKFIGDPIKDQLQAQENTARKPIGILRKTYIRAMMKVNQFFDSQYDKKRGIETCDLVFISDLKDDPVDFSEFLIDELYGALPVTLFDAMHSPADYISKTDCTYVDVGAGKARPLILAAEHGYKKVLGIEYVPSLAQTGRDNCSIALAGMKDVTWENKTEDATTMKYPDTDLVVLACNPFDRPMFDRWLENLLQDLNDNPREMVLIYHHSICSHLLDAAPELERLDYSWIDSLKIYLFNPHPYGAWSYNGAGKRTRTSTS